MGGEGKGRGRGKGRGKAKAKPAPSAPVKLNPEAPEFVPGGAPLQWPNPNAAEFQPGQAAAVQTVELLGSIEQSGGKGSSSKRDAKKPRSKEREESESMVKKEIQGIVKKHPIWEEKDFDWRAVQLMVYLLEHQPEEFRKCIDDDFWGLVDGRKREDHFNSSLGAGGGAKRYIWAWLRKTFPEAYQQFKKKVDSASSGGSRRQR
mmetsp:Transcript_25025/g.60691  ORF Transcript_25025/g.60691 Transcript_25025/m.60691 type:complete len:204 (-) Transcript_25025:276-887(-)